MQKSQAAVTLCLYLGPYPLLDHLCHHHLSYHDPLDWDFHGYWIRLSIRKIPTLQVACVCRDSIDQHLREIVVRAFQDAIPVDSRPPHRWVVLSEFLLFWLFCESVEEPAV